MVHVIGNSEKEDPGSMQDLCEVDTCSLWGAANCPAQQSMYLERLSPEAAPGEFHLPGGQRE